MHIKTNIEHNMIQIIILAICPLLLVVNNIGQAVFFAIATSICFIISAFVCGMFNRYFSRNIKIFVTAVLSSFIITILDFILKQEPKFGLESNSDCFYAVLSTICLCLDVYVIDSNSLIKLHMIKTLITCGIFSGILIIFALIVELLGSGSIFGAKLFTLQSGEFFNSITFKLILLGVITVIADYIYRLYQRKAYEKKIVYEKYVRKIREEKMFQYDELRRKKLLTSRIEINNVKEEFIEKINQKNAENQSIEADIKDSLKQPENTVLSLNTNKNKKKSHKLKLKIDVDRQERERRPENNVNEEVVEEDVNSSKKDKKKKKFKGKSKVERVFGSNSNPNGDKKN